MHRTLHQSSAATCKFIYALVVAVSICNCIASIKPRILHRDEVQHRADHSLTLFERLFLLFGMDH